MNKQAIFTPNAPAAIGPYSPAIRVGDFLFVSGQTPIDPATGQLIADNSVGAQTRRALRNIQAVVTAAGGSLNAVVKTTVFLRDMADFAEMNGAYEEFFGEVRPARSTVAVAGLPKDARVEIECIAVLG